MSRGYSIVEIAIALVVLGLLLGAIATPLQHRLERADHEETEQILAASSAAVIGYAVANRTIGRTVEDPDRVPRPLPAGRPYLPCPDIDGDGLEDRSAVNIGAGATIIMTVVPAVMATEGVCAQNKGLLPWRTLGMREQSDPWGRRIGYRVDPIFASQITGFDETFRADIFDPRITMTADANGEMFFDLRATRHEAGGLVCSATAGGAAATCPDIAAANIPNLLAGVVTTVEITIGARITPAYTRAAADGILDGAAFVLYSHGKNGLGGITAGPGGRCVPVPNRTPRGERINAFYRNAHPMLIAFGCSSVDYGNSPSENLFFSAPVNDETGDDILVWTSPNALLGALLQAGALPIPALGFLPAER